MSETPEPRKLTAWSYSRWKDHRWCPRRCKFKYIDKLPDPSGPAAERGSAVHKAAEEFLQGKLTKNPFVEFGPFKRELDKLKARTAITAEEQWAFTASWGTTGWFDPDAWCRMGIDAHFILPKKNAMVIVDFKTGKVRDENLNQLGLYALGAFTRNPDLDEVHLEFWYLDAQVDQYVNYKKHEFPLLKEEWELRVAEMLNDTLFAMKPGPQCRWCTFRKANGGPCDF
jgi:hypothetical protein